MPEPTPITVEQLRDQVASSLIANFGDALHGSAEDVRFAMSEASDRMVRTLAAGRPDLAKKVQGQFRVIMERNRVRLTGATTDMLQAGLTTVARFAVGMVDSGLLVLADRIAEAADAIDDAADALAVETEDEA